MNILYRLVVKCLSIAETHFSNIRFLLLCYNVSKKASLSFNTNAIVFILNYYHRLKNKVNREVWVALLPGARIQYAKDCYK